MNRASSLREPEDPNIQSFVNSLSLNFSNVFSRYVSYTEYYPFGLQASTSWTRDNSRNDFKYNGGSELNNTTGYYDLFYRNYDAATGRFMQPDPLAAMYSSMSSYHYSGNNPVMYNDPNGDRYMNIEMPRYGGGDIGRYASGGGTTTNAMKWQNYYEQEDYEMALLGAQYGNEAALEYLGAETIYSNGAFNDRHNSVTGYMVYALDKSGNISGDVEVTIDGFNIYSGQAQQGVDRTTFEVKNSALDSFGWDWFIETTRSTNASESVVSNYYIQTAVIIVYNTNPKDWGRPKYGQVVQQIGRTRSLIQDAGGIHPHKDLPYSPSQLMKEFIQGAKNYHCGGCHNAPTALDKYLNFLLTPKEQGGNWLTPSGVHR